MKIISLLAFCLFSLVFILQGDDLQARAKSYPLMCRGGGAMKAKITSWNVTVNFVGAKQGAGVRPPQPGECAWLDRGWRPGEPQEFVWKLGDKMSDMIMYLEPQGVTMVHTESLKFNVLSDALLQKNVFQVHAYRGQCPGPKCHVLTVTDVN
jgi:hypothetical protein